MDEGSGRQHLFLLCGLPFSGKSTMGRALAEQLGIIHIEVDRHHFQRSSELDERRVERAEWIGAYRASYAEVEAALASGKSVVFDAVSYRRTQRDRVRRIAEKHGMTMTIILMGTSPELAKDRMAANRKIPIRPIVPETDFEEVRQGMQPPMSDEPYVRYDPVEPLSVWINREVAPMMNRDQA